MNTLSGYIKGIATAKDAEIYLIMREGGKEATNRNAFNWQSAYAILELETIIKNAAPKNCESIFVPAKIQEIKKRTNM